MTESKCDKCGTKLYYCGLNHKGEVICRKPMAGDEGSLGVAEPIEPEIKKYGIVEESVIGKIFKPQERIVTQEEWAEAMVGHLTKRKMKLGSIVARFAGDVTIKDVDDNAITVTFSKDISPENKAEIQSLILKLFEEINESPIIIKQDGLT